MSKRATYELRPRDKYFSPLEAVQPLKGFLDSGMSFCEPCAGDNRLVGHLESLFDATCFHASDIEPNSPLMVEKDGLDLTEEDVAHCEYIITNPPFTWNVLQPLMDHFIALRPTLLLLPADFMHNKRMSPYMKKCEWVKSIGRVRWIEGSKGSGVDNYCWYMFNKGMNYGTLFYGRD